jgi:hypothetical protein
MNERSSFRRNGSLELTTEAPSIFSTGRFSTKFWPRPTWYESYDISKKVILKRLR